MNVSAIKPVRYFTPTQTLEQQIAIWNELVQTTPKNGAANVHLITPQLAKWLLENWHGGNRRPSSAAIETYMEAMEERDWPITGATIVVGASGKVMDGQHRLIACVRANVAFHTYVVFSVDDASFTRIDTGRKRTNVDAFVIEGIKNPGASAKAARWLRIFEADPVNRSLTFTNDDLLKWVKGAGNIDRDLFDECVAKALMIKRASAQHGCEMPEGPMAALLYLFYKSDAEKADYFVDALKTGKRQPAIAIYSNIKAVKAASGGRVSEALRNGRIVQAWNALKDGKRINVSLLDYTPVDHIYPTIK